MLCVLMAGFRILRTDYLLMAAFYLQVTTGCGFHPLDDLEGFHLDDQETALNHVHKFVHTDTKTGARTFLEYNVTKCPKERYLVIPPRVELDCASDSNIVLTFREKKSAWDFSRKVSKGLILFSHHKTRCQHNGKGILMEVIKLKRLDRFRCQVHGLTRSPAEFFKHAEIEFTTNVVPEKECFSDRRCSTSPGNENTFHALEIGRRPTPEHTRGVIDHLRKNMTAFEGFENLTQSAYIFYRDSEKRNTLLQLSNYLQNVNTNTIRSMGGWKIPFPSEILWEDPIYPRMLCMNCYLRVQPVLRFSLHIENYRIKKFHISMDASTYLAIFPHVDIHESGVIQRFKLLERSFQPVYLSIGGLPYFITPHFKVTLKFAHKLNTKAEIGFQTGFIGAIHFGISTKNSIPEVFGNMSFQQVPVDFVFSMGKSCSSFKSSVLQHTLEECAALCATDSQCKAFQYIKSTNACQLTNECNEIDNPSGNQFLFKYQPWVKPPPNPQVTGTARIMVTSHLLMLLNGIGGPMASMNQSLNWHFIRTNMLNVSRTTIDYKVNAAVGGRVQLRLGNSYIYEDELKFKPVVSRTETLWSHDYQFSK